MKRKSGSRIAQREIGGNRVMTITYSTARTVVKGTCHIGAVILHKNVCRLQRSARASRYKPAPGRYDARCSWEKVGGRLREIRIRGPGLRLPACVPTPQQPATEILER